MNHRVIARLAAGAAVALVAAAGQAQVYSTSPSLPVPPTGTGPGTMSATLNVAGAPASITDVNLILDITHTYEGDLDIILVPPSGDRYIHLTSDTGAGGDNFSYTRFDQQSSVAINAGVAPAVSPFNGTFRPEGGAIDWRAAASIPLPGFPLAGFDDLIGTNPNGTWTLIIDDDAGGDSGFLNYMSLEINGAVDPLGPSFGTPPQATASASPSTVPNDGTGVTTLTVTVTPGAAPTSTFSGSGSVTVDGSAIGLGTITLLDNGVFPDQVAGDLVFAANATVPNGTSGNQYVLTYNVTDDQARSANGNINLTVTAPPPDCAPGLASLSFTGVQSNGAVGNGSNSVVTGDFGLPGSVNQITVTGRFTSIPASYRSEARIRITAPDGSFYTVGPFAGAPTSAGVWEFTDQVVTLPTVQSGTGTWSFEFWESYDDGVNPDAIWDGACFTANLVATNPSATDTSTPGTVARDGVQQVVLAVNVSPGQVPLSTGLSVTVDASSVGGSGSLSLSDDGNFPDAAAGDGIYTGVTTVAYTTPTGGASLPYSVTDAQGRSFADTLNFTVIEANGACCTSSGCMVTSVGDCIDVQGGSFAGHLTACNTPTPMSTSGAGAFEDISSTGTALSFANTDDSVTQVFFPFPFTFFGTAYNDGYVSTNGNLQFGTNNSTAFGNGLIPSAGVPNNALYALWDDFNLWGTGTIYTQLLGTPGVDARFIIQWNAGQYAGFQVTPADLSVFQIALFEDGNFEFRYQTVSPEGGTAGTGDTSTIGFEDITGTVAVTVPETRDSLGASAPISYRGNSQGQDTGVCGGGCPACSADYDQDGGVSGADIAAFFADFEQGATCADVDQDGGISGADIGTFFAQFEAGGC